MIKLRTRLAAVLAFAAIAVSWMVASPAQAATVGVAVRVGGYWCPSGWTPYVRGVEVSPNGYNAIYGHWVGWSTSPTVTVTGVPSSGGSAQVVVAYSCKGYWFWQQTTPAPIYGTRWAYGSGYQPTWWF